MVPSGGCGRLLEGARAFLWMVALLCATGLRAELQFDVFVGYGSGGVNDGIVREGAWFPVGCEVYNDGPPFDAVFEFSSRRVGADQSLRMKLELPTNTRKRFVIPVFAGGSRYASWDARLFDERGKVRGEQPDLRSVDISWETFLIGGLPRAFGGLPVFPKVQNRRREQHPQVARMTAEHFPDNPLALEGLDALYLNSEKALELSAGQVGALLAWVHGGGHLIVAPEQMQDIASTPWLRNLLPIEFSATATLPNPGALHAWVKSGAELTESDYVGANAYARQLPVLNVQTSQRAARRVPDPNSPYAKLASDPAFEAREMTVFAGTIGEGETVLEARGVPLVVSGSRGRGQVTALTFSPEREPLKSWKHRPWFWARLAGLPGRAFAAGAQNIYGGRSTDEVFGAMLDSRQVRKLPVQWLLALLLIYLIVIGPLDQWWLKKINRQMLTWLTFPAYVILFSLLIYWIGYKLRAGDTEWNELHLVDILPRAEQVELRGRTFASLYSSVNARYELGSDQPYAMVRSEFLGPWSGGRQSSAVRAEVKANAFAAVVSVPVWTSSLYVSDWQQPSATPFSAAVSREGNSLVVEVKNYRSTAFPDVRLVYGDRLYQVGELAAGQTKVARFPVASGRRLDAFVKSLASKFQTAAGGRRQAFGQTATGRLDLTPDNVLAASFISQAGIYQNQQRRWVFPPGTDLSPLVARGDAVLLAWNPGQTLATSPLRRFDPPRTSRNTMLRLSVPVTPAES